MVESKSNSGGLMNQANHNSECETLHQKIVHLASKHRFIEAELLDHLQEAEKMRLHLYRSHSSLFRYVVDELGFSDAVASNLITVARKALEVPEIKEEVRQGKLGISKLRKVCPVIDKKNQKEWIQAAKTSSSRELEMKVASLKQNHIPRSSLRAIAKDTLRLSLDISHKAEQKLLRLKDLLSTKKGRDCTLQEVLDLALETTIEKVDPVRKAKRSQKRGEKKAQQEKALNLKVPEEPGKFRENQSCRIAVGARHASPDDYQATRPGTRSRKALSQCTVDALNRRDQVRCTYVGANSKRCTQTRWLDFHHKVPLSKGGSDEPQNLITLCHAHHKLLHETTHLMHLYQSV
jgi:5-methylcytosine-specific restriction endonuclease McrA